jgi:hypothetical protein
VCDKETTSKTRGDQEILEPLIRWLKKTTGFHLHAFTFKERSTKLYKYFIEHLMCMTKEATQIKAGRGKRTLDRVAIGTWAQWHGS